jgi:predicted  nucleic acid-binding Zn-ribbon protein
MLNISTVDYQIYLDEFVKLAGPEPPHYETIDAKNTTMEIEKLNAEMEIIKEDFRTQMREMKGVMDIQALRIEQLQLEIGRLKLQADLS